MSTYLPTIFGENLMDVFDDFDRDFFRGFGNIDRALYGKHAQRMMKTDVKETDEATKWMWSCRASRRTRSSWS